MKKGLFLILLCMLLSVPAFAANFTFTNTGVTPGTAGSGYAIDGTSLTIQEAGTYTVTGNCSNGNITVDKSVTGVTLILQNLSLTATDTAPLICKASTDTTLSVSGTVTLTDAENPADETTSDSFEGAAIKVKKNASLRITGSGTLMADGSTCKNGIKGGESASVTVSGGVELVVKAANNGIASDGSVKFDGGTTSVTADGDGVKASPDDGDTTSAGTVTLNAGTLTIDAQDDGIQAANGVTVSGGTLDATSAGNGITSDGDISVTGGNITISAGGDGIQTAGNLSITGGTFDVTTFGGYQNVSSLGDNSAKGLKASSDAETPTNTITITGGTFKLNTADDAIHSDNNVTVTGGVFDIYTGDDGVHADSVLTLGENGGKDPALKVNVLASYEGLEGTEVNILSGCYDVTTSDDGINAAGGSSNGSDPGGPMGPGGGRDNFRPFSTARLQGNGDTVRYSNTDTQFPQNSGTDAQFPQNGDTNGQFPRNGRGNRQFPQENGQFPQNGDTNGQFPQNGGANGQFPQDANPRRQGGERAQLFADSAVSLNISGGTVKVNAGGDGLDSNGALNLTGGNIVVWGQQAGYDNEPLDCDGALTVKGATVFAAGGTGMGSPMLASGSQTAVTYRSSTIPTGRTISVKNADSSTVVALQAVKPVNYVFFSSPSATSAWAITAGNANTKDNCDVTGHAWDDGTEQKEATCTVAGTMLYTCTVCGAEETVTIPAPGHHYVSGRCSNCGEADPNTQNADPAESSGYTVTFQLDHATVKVYKTQTVSEETLDSSGTYYARNGDTGAIVTGGNGQVNFVVTPEEGYTLESVTASPEGSYHQVKTVDAAQNLYRVTKISANVTVTVKTSAVVSKAGFSYTLDGTSALVKLGYEKIGSVRAGTAYVVILGWYSEDGRFLGCHVADITLDADKYAELTVDFPESFHHCYAFLMDADKKQIPQSVLVQLTDATSKA